MLDASCIEGSTGTRSKLATPRRSEHEGGNQRLFRRETRRDPENARVFWITSDWLDQFALDALALEREMYGLRAEDGGSG